jgi:DNA polymerase-3 subunit beta
MKLSFAKNDLLNVIQTVQSCISVKSTLPILSNLLIQAEKDPKGSGSHVKVEATDLEVGVRSSVKAEVTREGKITVPAKKFGDIIREMPDGAEIELSVEDGKKIELKCGKVRASLVALSPEDFPVIPEFPKTGSFSLSKTIFREMIRKTSFAISSDETRHVLNGIFFSADDTQLRMVATDGRRLALISKENTKKNMNASAIIPSKAIGELLRLLALGSSADEDKILIAPTQNQIAFKWTGGGEETVLVSRVIDGTFPNYDQVIPKTKEIELKVRTSEMLSAVKRASLFAQDRGGSVRISIGGGSLKISANAQGVGEEEEEIDVAYAGPNFEIAFNPAFLLDVLKSADQPEVRFEFTTSLNPGVIKPYNNDTYICVVMPMRLQ